MKTIELKNIDKTKAWAREFAHTLHAPITVALHGDLGMGKSEIARAIIQELCGADTVVPSPTFTLVQSYVGADIIRPIDASAATTLSVAKRPMGQIISAPTISHFDLYRINDISELEEIGLSHAIANDITLIEWPEIAENFLPKNTIHIYITEFDGGRKLAYNL